MGIADVHSAFDEALGNKGTCTGATMIYEGANQVFTFSIVPAGGGDSTSSSLEVPPGVDPVIAARNAAEEWEDE